MTSDGSHTISISEMNVTYRSVHGAIQESLHVFIEAGLNRISPVCSTLYDPVHPNRPEPIRILEIGFGTGLNALLTLIESDKLKHPIQYRAVELFPLDMEEVLELNYCEQPGRSHYQILFEKLHQSEWNKDISITPFFIIHKTNSDFITFSTAQSFNLVYFDAFAPAAQPELWTKEVFEKLYNMMFAGGILVTYCCKGDVRRAMQAAGFNTEKIPGPPGKREMLRAGKFR